MSHLINSASAIEGLEPTFCLNNGSWSAESIEYDDDAIINFQPNLRTPQSYLCDSYAGGEQNKLATGADDTVPDVQGIADRILSEVRTKIENLSNDIKTARSSVKELSGEFEEMHKQLDKMNVLQKQTLKSGKKTIEELDIVNYHNTVIKHLIDSAAQMKLLQYTVTDENKFYFVDPDDIGTDVDTQTETEEEDIFYESSV